MKNNQSNSRSSKSPVKPSTQNPPTRTAGQNAINPVPLSSTNNNPSTFNASRDRNSTSVVATSASTPIDEIVIHVIDEAHDLNKDFKIERALLTKHMRYFQKCLKDIPP